MFERVLRSVVIGICFLFLLEGLSWFTAAVPPCLIAERHNPQTADDYNHKDCPTFFAGSLILFGQLDHFIEAHDKSIVAGFTIVLAISTIGLWLATIGLQGSTNRLWEAGERQIGAAEKAADAALMSAKLALGTERPLLYVKPEIILSEDGLHASVKFTIINLGRTPAILDYGTYSLKNYPGGLPPNGVSHKHFQRIERYQILHERGESEPFEWTQEVIPGQTPFTKKNVKLLVRLYYADVFGTVRQADFCFGWPKRRGPFLRHDLRRVGGDKYNYERIYRD
jgi:hypothetical protein